MDDGFIPEVVHEAEAQRQHPRVRIPGKLAVAGSGGERAHALIDLSAGGVAFDAASERYAVGQTLRGRLVFNVAPVAFALPVKLQVRNVSGEDRRIGASFQDLGPREVSVLRQIIHASLSGELVSVGDVLTALSRDNFTKARSVKEADASLSGRARTRAVTVTTLMFVIGLIAFIYAISKLYTMAFVSQASAAKIAAPGFSLSMPRDGTFFSLVPDDGIVRKGQPLATFQAAMLDVVQGDIGSLNLDPRQLSELMGETLKGTLNSPCDCRVRQQLALDGQYAGRGQPLFELAPLDAKPYVVARFRFDRIDQLPIGRTVSFRISGESGERSGKVRDVRLLSSASAAAGDARGLDGAGSVSDVVVTIEPSKPLDPALIDRPVNVSLGSASALGARLWSMFAQS